MVLLRMPWTGRSLPGFLDRICTTWQVCLRWETSFSRKVKLFRQSSTIVLKIIQLLFFISKQRKNVSNND